MKCPDCGGKALSVKAGYACGICGTLNADGHTLRTFLDTLTEKEDDLFWLLACESERFFPSLQLMSHIVGRFGVNPKEPGTCQWHEFEREWQEKHPDKVRHQ